MEKLVQDILKQCIYDLYETELDTLDLSIPPKKKLWDFAFACFPLAKIAKKSPQDIADEIQAYVEKKDFPAIKKLDKAWPYLNIFIKRTKQETLKYIQELQAAKTKQQESFAQENNWNTIIVDYIWANVWKPLHIGHMCTPCQWQSIINSYKASAYNVISDSHIWDWGIIFWKLIVAYKKYWDETQLNENAVEHLLELYVKITADTESDESLWDDFREAFKKLSEWDSESVQYWKMFTSRSIEAMNIQLARLHVQPDYNIWESFYEGIWLPKIEDYPDLQDNMHEIVEELVDLWIATKNADNSVWVNFPEDTAIPSCILQKQNGTHGYLASDLACIKYRMQNWAPEKIVYSVDVRQKLHFEQAFYISKAAGWLKRPWKSETILFHAYNWFISGKEWAFSTRKGNIIPLHEVLDEAEIRAKKLILEKRQDFSEDELNTLSKIIWIWAIKYGYLKKKRTTDVVFDWEEFMTFEWNSGPYIQYAYVRASKILVDHSISSDIDFSDSSQYTNATNLEKAEQLTKKLQSYYHKEWALQESLEKNMPHLIAQYSYEITKSFNDFYDKVRITSETDENMKNAFISIVWEYKIVIEQCFSILWIELPTEM